MFIRKLIPYYAVAVVVFTCFASPVQAQQAAPEGFHLGADIYASHTNLMPYKGYEDDVSATVYGQYSDIPVYLFIRALSTGYYYLLPTATEYSTDHRNAFGAGLDYRIFRFLKFRIIVEDVNNQLSNTKYRQDSYGLIYNHYLEYPYIEFNNYIETFLIPRVSPNKLDTVVRLQALKSFYLTRSLTVSNAVYPFFQIKAKFNDDTNFGITGQNASVGAGYKFYADSESQTQNFSAVLEAHAMVYQSRDFHGDTAQAMAAIQWIIN